MGLNRKAVTYAMACVATTLATLSAETADKSITGIPRTSEDGPYLVVISPDSIQGILDLRHVNTESVLERIQRYLAESRAQAAGFYYPEHETTDCFIYEVVHDVKTDKLNLKILHEIAVMQDPCAESALSLATAVLKFKKNQDTNQTGLYLNVQSLLTQQGTSLHIRLSADDAWQYVVEPGDTGGEIARRLNGEASLWPTIHDHNSTNGSTADPDLLFAGQSLEIPPNLMSDYIMRSIPTTPYFTTDSNQSLEQIASPHQYSATSLAVLKTLNTRIDSLPNENLSEEHQLIFPAEVSTWQTVPIQTSNATTESLRIYGTDHFRVMLATLCSHALKRTPGTCVVPNFRLARESTLQTYLQQR